MSSYPIVNFKQLCNFGKMVKDAVYRGERMQAMFKGNCTSNDEWRRKRDDVMTHSHKKKFDDIQVTLSELFEALLENGYLKPLDPTPLPNPVPRSLKMNEYCAFHQKLGHKRNSCMRLKH
jgi:hypothetical protein